MRHVASVTPQRIEEIVASVALDAGDAQAELVDALAGQFREGTPELVADPVLARELGTVVEASVLRVHRLLAEPELAVLAVPAATMDFARATARYGLPLISLIEACRLAQATTGDWWRHRLSDAIDDREVLIAANDLVQARVAAFIDLVVAQSRAAHAEEHEEWEGGASGRRVRVVHRLLAREPVDTDDASRVLNHPLRATQTAFVLWSDEDHEDPTEGTRVLHAAADELAAALGATRVLTIPFSDRSVWTWAVTENPAGHVRLALPAPLSAAVGSARPGLAGFRRSHHEALEAQRVALLQGERRDPVTRYTDVEVLALMSRDPEDLREFLHRTLGPLAAAGDGAARLRETLGAFLAAGNHVAGAARILGVHRNTISYRLRALEDALGPALGGRRVDLELALDVIDRLGAPD